MFDLPAPLSLLVGGLVMFVFLKAVWDQTIVPLLIEPVSNYLHRRRLERIVRGIKKFEAGREERNRKFLAAQQPPAPSALRQWLDDHRPCAR